MNLRHLGAGALALALTILAPDGTAQAAGPPVKGKLTDVSAARRLHHVRIPDRNAGLRVPRYRGHAGRGEGRARAAARMDGARHPEADRDGRGYASAPAGLPAPVRTVTHRRAHGVVLAAIQGASIGGQVAVEHSRPRECYGIAWCGCWLRTALGIPDRSLNLAINWARVGSPASREEANIVVWAHHVAQVLGHDRGRILIRSGNDRGAVRTRWVSPGILGGVRAWRRV